MNTSTLFSLSALLALNFISLSSTYPRKGSTLIVGGVEAERHEFPFMIDVRKTSHSCGASIVNSEWVVTAAHCTQSAISSYTLVAGDHDNSADEGTEQRRQVERIVNHPSYRPGSHEFDISLMKVAEPFEFNQNVQPVALPAAGFIPTDNTTAAGWGRTSEGGISSNRLMKVSVPYVEDQYCRQAYGADRITDHMICAGSGGKDACQGDSGGPLLCNVGSTSFVCGIVSWGTGCARPEFPGVYTEVSYFTEWINSVISTA